MNNFPDGASQSRLYMVLWIWSDDFFKKNFWLDGALLTAYINCAFDDFIVSKMFLMIAVWFISYTKSDFTHGISLLKNNSGSGKTQRSTVITKHRDWRDCENICNILASKCTSFIWMKPSEGETGGHCHFMVRRDPSIQTCNDRTRATGAIWNNVAGYKKHKIILKPYKHKQKT